LNNPLRVGRIVDRDAIDSHGFSRVVIAPHIQGIADINHLVYRNTEDVSQSSDAICFVDARPGYVDRCRAAGSDRELRNKLLEDRFDPSPLGHIGVPFILFLQRGLLT